jgi:glutamate/tyrosine decarboxylase-like PLP-dependent enzyme
MIHPQLKADKEYTEVLLHDVLLEGMNFLNTIDRLPTGKKTEALEALTLPQQAAGAGKALQQFKNHFVKHIAASGGPRYFGFVTGGSTPAALAGDWLTAVYDQNTQSTTGFGDCSALLELETITLLLQLLGLPDNEFTGGFVTGATMSNFTCLAVARQWMGKQKGIDIAKEGVIAGLKVYAATPHSSAIKSLAMLGMGSRNYIPVPVLRQQRTLHPHQQRRHGEYG